MLCRWKKPSRASLLTNEYYDIVSKTDPFDNEVEVYRGIEENLSNDRGKVNLLNSLLMPYVLP